MPSAARSFSSESDYLGLDRSSPVRHERIAGSVHAMGGASLRHNRLVGNLFAELRRRAVGGPCEVFTSDLRLRVEATGLFAYPDVLVICGPPELWDDPLDTVLNPAMIVEVLSPSTEAYDRGEKFAGYRHIPTLERYLMVHQDRTTVEAYTRQGDLWILESHEKSTDTVDLGDLGQLPLKDLYANLA